MYNKQLKYRVRFLLVLLCFMPLFVRAQGQTHEETSRLVLFFGRFHPLLLHLPIGALVLAFFIDIIGRFKKNYPEQTLRLILGFTAIFSILTALLGYFLSLEGGYGATTLDIHFYTGLLTAALASTLYFLSRKKGYYKGLIFMPLFILTLMSLTVTGHYGSVLTHGENFITEYAKAPKKERTITVVDSLRWYPDVVFKIFDDKCMQCHNDNKTKGELSMVTPASLLIGGENGIIVEAGKARESLLYKHLVLPLNHEDHMPPEGKPQLTNNEIRLIEAWIDAGLDFENYIPSLADKDPLKPLLASYLVFEQVRIPMASQANIAKVEQAGFMVTPIVPGSSALSVKFVGKEVNKSKVKSLSALEEQLVELDFSNTDLSDNMTSGFRQFENLIVLRLDKTSITDKTLSYLKKLKQLDVLNLYETAITDQGLSALLSTIQPTKIYAWKTKVTKTTALALAAQNDVNIYHGLADGFIEVSQLERPSISPDQTLFVDNIQLELQSKFKNVDLRYTLDGSNPDSTSTKFTVPIDINESKELKVRAFKNGWLPSEVTQHTFSKIKHRIESFTIVDKPEKRYPGADKLFDLKEGSMSFKDGNWTGYYGFDVNTTIDLGAAKTVDHVSVNCMKAVGDWILLPTKFTVFAAKAKGSPFVEIGSLDLGKSDQNREPKRTKFTVDVEGTTAQFFKIIVENPKTLPSWHEGAGQPAWIFVDEIYVW